jgi:hypothetical protein
VWNRQRRGETVRSKRNLKRGRDGTRRKRDSERRVEWETGKGRGEVEIEVERREKRKMRQGIFVEAKTGGYCNRPTIS